MITEKAPERELTASRTGGWFDLGDIGRKPGLVVSNNVRNRQLGTVLVARVTTSNSPSLQSIVELSHADHFTGRVLCDDLIEI